MIINTNKLLIYRQKQQQRSSKYGRIKKASSQGMSIK